MMYFFRIFKKARLSRSARKRAITYLTVSTFLFQTIFSSFAHAITNSELRALMNADAAARLAETIDSYLYLTQDFVAAEQDPSAFNLEGLLRSLQSSNSDSVSGFNSDDLVYVAGPALQQRLVRQQIHHLLGRHLIDPRPDNPGYRTEIEQLQTLFINGQTVLNQPGRNFGEVYAEVATPEELDNAQMIYPEIRTIGEHSVLVPVVYLSKETIDTRQVREHQIEFDGAIKFNNITFDGVNVDLGRNAVIDAAGDIINANGSVISGADDVIIGAAGSFRNLSSQVIANQHVSIIANYIENQTLVHRYDFGDQQGYRYGEIASINAGADVPEGERGNVLLQSYGDIINLGGNVSADQGSIRFDADGNILIGTQELASSGDFSIGDWDITYSNVDHLISNISAKDSIDILADGAVVIDAARMTTDEGHIQILGQLGVSIENKTKEVRRYNGFESSKETTNESLYRTYAIRAFLDAGDNVTIHSTLGDVRLRAVDVTSTNGTSVNADNGAVELLLSKEIDEYSYTSVSEGAFSIVSTNEGRNIERAVQNTFVGGFEVNALKGVTIEYEGIKDLECDKYIQEKSLSLKTWVQGTGAEQETITENACLRANIHMASQIEGMGWLADQLEIADLNPQHYDWKAVSLKYETWSESTRALSPLAMAVIAVVAAAATAGASLGANAATAAGQTAFSATSALGIGLAETTVVAITEAAVQAGIAALVSRAATIGAQGIVSQDFSRAADDLFSSDTYRSIATSMLTAGVMQSLNIGFFDGKLGQSAEQLNIEDAVDSLLWQATDTLVSATVSAGSNFLINGGNSEDLEQLFIFSVGSSVVNKLGENIANGIRDAKLEDASRYMAHMLLGCGLGALDEAVRTGNDDEIGVSCASGAGGALIGEITGTIYSELTETENLSRSERDQWRLEGIAFSEVMGMILVDFAGGDFRVAGLTAENAARNNALSTYEIAQASGKAVRCFFSEGIGDCLRRVKEETQRKAILNTYSYITGFGTGFDNYITNFEELPGELKDLVVTIFDSDIYGLLNLIESAAGQVDDQIFRILNDFKDSAVLLLAADGTQDWNRLGELQGALTGEVAFTVLTAGAGKLAKLGLDSFLDAIKNGRRNGNDSGDDREQDDYDPETLAPRINLVKEITGGSLIFHENVGGHVIERHVGKNDSELIDRFNQQPNLKGSSTFETIESAERAIGDVLLGNVNKIDEFLANGSLMDLPLRLDVGYTAGRVVPNGATASVESSVVFVLLRKDPLAPNFQYRIHTAFPERP